MQLDDGSLKKIDELTYQREIIDKHGKAKVIRVGDTFRVNGCFFEVSAIDAEGIRAIGIPEVEYSRHVGRNESCPCGSGLKYKKCCMNKEPRP